MENHPISMDLDVLFFFQENLQIFFRVASPRASFFKAKKSSGRQGTSRNWVQQGDGLYHLRMVYDIGFAIGSNMIKDVSICFSQRVFLISPQLLNPDP